MTKIFLSSSIVSTSFILILIQPVELGVVCRTTLCKNQAEEILKPTLLKTNECDEFYKLACGNTFKGDYIDGLHFFKNLIFKQDIQKILLNDETVELKKYPLIKDAFEKFRNCAKPKGEWDACYDNLTDVQRLASHHYVIRKMFSPEAKNTAKLVANGILRAFRDRDELFKFGDYLPDSEFRNRLSDMKIEVGYADNFDQLNHSNYLDDGPMRLVETSQSLIDKLSPAPFWLVDMVMGNATYYVESNTIYVPLIILHDPWYFKANALEVYNYATLGVLIAQVIVREFIVDLKSAGTFSPSSSVPQISYAITCVREQLLTIREYRLNRTYSREKIVNETMNMMIEEIIIDSMALRAAYAAFAEADYRSVYDFSRRDKRFKDETAQFFLLFSQNHCAMKMEGQITNALDFITRDKVIEYYRVTLPLKNNKKFDEKFNCNSKKMAHTACISEP